MKPAGASLFLVSLLLAVGLTACQARSSPAPASSLLETRVIEYAGARFDIVSADLSRVDPRLLRQDASGQPLKTFHPPVLQGSNARTDGVFSGFLVLTPRR
ncbi:hypothetical protein [Corallococcus terminator]|uniref:Uncharacterized protein n=1 Tax=Corallococcus terminator TaxID=2316733 RepID=A0A3A8J8T2_9BACT|nr:hypothetical protein [Corallococcus terminator]RKG92099.1 hypothetical protein D7V88_07440 [Corallococcus terminator]